MAAALVLLVPLLASAQPWAAFTDLRQLALIDPTDRVDLRSSYCPSGCRFDRTSDGDTRFLRVSEDEAVIFESTNPGAIVRVWMKGPARVVAIEKYL
jgi:hypothetical protein